MTRDQFLTEWLGECWHEWNRMDFTVFNNRVKCEKCGDCVPVTSGTDFKPRHDDFSSWPGFGKLWEAAQKDEEWKLFLQDIASIDASEYEFPPANIDWLVSLNTVTDIINPDRFAIAWAKFKGWKE